MTELDLERCPICRAPVDPAARARPFCSARCQRIDLGRWLNEEYRISSPLGPEALAELEPFGAAKPDEA